MNKARPMKWKRWKTQIDNFTEERANILFTVLIRHSSLDENNYDMTDIANVEEKEIDVPLEKKGNKSQKKLLGPPRNRRKTSVKVHRT